MTNLTRSNFQAHPFHLVSPSPWPLFTCVALLTLTTAGMLFTMLALNQVICWDILNLEVKGLSAGSLIGFDLLSILRDYTLEFFYCMDLSQVRNWLAIHVGKNGDISGRSYSGSNFRFYLAGLIEGDGTIIVPKPERSAKGRLNYPSIQIIFNSRYLPLALLIQQKLGLVAPLTHFYFKINLKIKTTPQKQEGSAPSPA